MNQKRFINQLEELVRIDSPSLEEGELSFYLAEFFRKEGLEVWADQSGASYGSNGQNVLVHIPGSLKLPPICFNAHMDTVEPGRGIEPIVRDGRMESKGDTVLGADDKAGIAILLEAYRELKENGAEHRELYYLFTLSEEIMQGAERYDTSEIQAEYMVVLDGAGSPALLCSASKGKTLLRYEFFGKSAHAGVDLDGGINAVCMAAEAVVLIQKGNAMRKESEVQKRNVLQKESNMQGENAVPEEEMYADTSVNISSLHGGTESPTVPDRAEVTVEVRSFFGSGISEAVQRLNKAAKASAEKYGGRVVIHETPVCPPYHADRQGYLYRRIQEAIWNQGMEPVEVRTGGSSDGNIFGAKGFSCAGLCLGMYQVHTTGEYLDLKELESAYRIVWELMTE